MHAIHSNTHWNGIQEEDLEVAGGVTLLLSLSNICSLHWEGARFFFLMNEYRQDVNNSQLVIQVTIGSFINVVTTDRCCYQKQNLKCEGDERTN